MAAWLAAVFGLVGVVLGAILASLFELWRRALEGQAAARAIRVETLGHRSIIQTVLDEHIPLRPFVKERLRTSAWDRYSLSALPFLTEEEYAGIAWSYHQLGIIVGILDTDWMKAEEQSVPFPTPRAQKIVWQWLEAADKNGKILRRVEATNSWFLAFRLLQPQRVSTPEQIQDYYKQLWGQETEIEDTRSEVKSP